MPQNQLPYDILQYIVGLEENRPELERGRESKLPPMDELAETMGVSRGKLREELVAAQAFGMVEMRPGDGTYVLPFDFYPPIRTLVLYAIERDRKYFDQFYRMRVELEAAFWDRAVRNLTQEDKDELQRIVERAERKLNGTPVEIPHNEHRDFHVTIFGRLENEFVQGVLMAYWDAYEAVGLHRYFDFSYYETMWASHRAMVEAIVGGDYEEGLRVLIEHSTMLHGRLPGGTES
jgi:DNA-binding FadR family transcriptional regulator